VAFSGVAVVWVFFFVPNPWLSFLRIQGTERLPAYVLFGVIPPVLALIAMFASTGRFSTRLGLVTCVPLFGFAVYLLTSFIGVYSDEGLTGYWLMLPFSLAAYFLGATVAAAIYWLAKRPKQMPSQHPPAL
jgi:hypothetical protein